MLLSHVPSYFKARRDALVKSSPGSAFILAASPEFLRNPDVSHPFRQESNFFYLSGFDEPESFLVLVPSKEAGQKYKTVLFVRKRDPEREMWDGERYGVEGATRVFGADEAYLTSELEAKLPDLLQTAEKVFYRVGLHEETDRKILAVLEIARRLQGRSGKALAPIADPQEILGEMRLFKSPDEIAALRKACQISGRAHKVAMQELRPGMHEYEIEAMVDYAFRKHGCQRNGYGSIVAGGKNAACLHYRANNEPLRDGELLLIDAGGEFDYYTADITRTYPVGREFSRGQAKAYDLVLRAQKECIAMAKPGAKLPEIHKHACAVISEGLLSWGLLKGTLEDVMKNNAFRRFYPHGTSHWLGMDVHDVGLYQKSGEPRALETGMVFTVEPGFYVQPADTDGTAEFRNIGIRIEDDILVTTAGHEVLTSEAPKERAEIEALRRF